MKFSQAVAAATLAVGAQSAAILTDDTTFRMNELAKMTSNNIVNINQLTAADVDVNMARIINTYRNMINVASTANTAHTNNFKRDCVFQGSATFCDEDALATDPTDPFALENQVLADPLKSKRQVTGFGRDSDSESADPLFQHDADHDDDVNDVRDAIADDIADDQDQDGGLTKRQVTGFGRDSDSESADPLFQHDADHDDDVNDVRDAIADDIADDQDQDGGLTKREVPVKVLSATVQKAICGSMSLFMARHAEFLAQTTDKAALITSSRYALPLVSVLRYFDATINTFNAAVLPTVPSCNGPRTAEAVAMTSGIAGTIAALSR